MPQGLKDWKERDEILTFEEILRVVQITVSLGFTKFRVTGGEPLVRRDAVRLIERIGAVPGVASFGLSTNATLLAPVAERIRAAGVDSINISLDTLDPAEYRRITLKDLESARSGIDAALRAGFPKVKLNAVLMRGRNEDQLVPLVRFAAEHGVYLRFIELMPVTTTEMLTRENFLSAAEAQRRISAEIPLERAAEVKLGHGPAVYYRTPDGQLIGFIGALTDLHFCDACNKVRLTADGKIRPCLGNHLEFDLKGILRSGGSDAEVAALFQRILGLKPAEHEFRKQYEPGRSMTAIGG
jgi:cyclic pyranopterin phosphate synthase